MTRLSRAGWPLAGALALAALATAGTAAPAAAQQDELDRVLVEFTSLWQSGDAGGLVRLGGSDGVELEVHGDAMGQLRGRRAVAALRQLFGAQRTVSVRPAELSRVAGTDNRAFAELTWEVRPEGAPMSERTTVFIAFVREGTRWKISQIRILP